MILEVLLDNITRLVDFYILIKMLHERYYCILLYIVSLLSHIYICIPCTDKMDKDIELYTVLISDCILLWITRLLRLVGRLSARKPV